MNEAIAHLPRAERRQLLKAEEKRRLSGEWGEWTRHDLPRGIPKGLGWCQDIRAAIKNEVFCVLVRPLGNGTTHLGVSSLSGIRPTFHEMQRIKNEICGEESVAVEIYPKQSELVDDADMFHLFVGAYLPAAFTIFTGRTQ